MIKKIRLQDFMSVENETIELSDINIFIGPTDSGKSTLMRSIDAVITNKYPAATYATHGKSKYVIAVVTDKGAVQLSKSKSTQYVTVEVIDGEKVAKEFNAVGRETPQEVRDILSMPYLPISESEVLDVLYQSQHKPFFLITENRDVFSKVIALISNADKLRSLEKLVNSDILIVKRTITQLKDVIVDYDRVIAEREVEVETLEPYKNISERYFDVLKEAEEVNAKTSKLCEVLQLNKEILQAGEISSITPFDLDKFTPLSDTAKTIKNLSDSISLLKIVSPEQITIPEFTNFDYEDFKGNLILSSVTVPETVETPLFIFDKLNKVKEAFIDSSKELPEEVIVPCFRMSAIQELRTILTNLTSINSDISALEETKQSVEEQMLSLVGATCPTCGAVLDEEHIKSLVHV